MTLLSIYGIRHTRSLQCSLQTEKCVIAANETNSSKFPKTIVLVTSPSSAAIRDMLNILSRRAPWVRILIGPAPVQGSGAGEEIARRIRWLGKASGKQLPTVDTIIVGRGGGSAEDLWCFNEEVLARSIASCPIPVVSAVGHEIDFTISDFVADLRAPTPSAAAELVVPDRAELFQQFERTRSRLQNNVTRSLQHWRTVVELLARSGAFREPGRVMLERKQRLDELNDRMADGARGRLSQAKDRAANAQRLLELSQPSRILQQRKERLVMMGDRLGTAARRQLAEFSRQVEGLGNVVRTLGPESVFTRGYSLTMGADGKALTSIQGLEPGEKLVTRLADGSLESEVTQLLQEEDD